MKIFGTLSKRGMQSYLVPQECWLLLDGYPDSRQAGDMATKLVQNLPDNTPVVVTGTMDTRGSQPVIIMSKIDPDGSLIAI